MRARVAKYPPRTTFHTVSPRTWVNGALPVAGSSPIHRRLVHFISPGRGRMGRTDRGLLRRVMCNELDQQVRQVAQRSVEGVVDPLSAGVCRDLGGQARQQPYQRLGPVALQSEEVLELADDPFYDLALAGGPAPIGLRPCPAGAVLGRRRHQRPVLFHPTPLPL